MRHAIYPVLSAVLMLAAATPAFAQKAPNAEHGRQFAQRICAECHAIRQNAAVSPVPAAPPFGKIATTPGMTGIALQSALLTSHRQMPNLALTREELNDVIAYILTLAGN